MPKYLITYRTPDGKEERTSLSADDIDDAWKKANEKYGYGRVVKILGEKK